MFEHSRRLWEEPPVSGSALLVLHYLAFRSDEMGKSYPGVALMAKETALSERGVQDAIKLLRKCGVITVSSGGGRNHTNVYTIQAKTPQMTAAKHPKQTSEEPAETPQHLHPATSAPFQQTPQMLPETPQMAQETPQMTALNPATSAPKEPITTIEQPNEPPRRKSAQFVTLPDWVPTEAWAAYEKSRKSLRCAMTEDARALNVRKLEELKRAGHDPRVVLECAIERSWRGLFPPPADYGTSNKPIFTNALEQQRLREQGAQA